MAGTPRFSHQIKVVPLSQNARNIKVRLVAVVFRVGHKVNTVRELPTCPRILMINIITPNMAVL